jgi:aminoglycoside phosphotransferase family enzyme/predicted kinase
MAGDTLPPHIQAMRRRAAYPGTSGRVELVQTHISWVFLVGDEVYKVKKPVNLGFANFTTLARRKAACEAEVRLNRRGCPGGVYLGVETLNREGDSFHVAGKGEVVDYAVHMKRLPQDGMMDKRLERGEVAFGDIGRVAARLAALHAEAERSERITRLGGTEALATNWQENLDQTEPFIGRTLSRARFDRIASYATRFMAGEEVLLKSREAEGWVRDCHGDLRSDSVVFDDNLPGGICIYDCIEFNDRFRYVDTALDAAFLAMDLDFRGHPDLSDLFVGLFTAASGDKTLPLLLHFYKCYRAVVRGKVESLLLVDPGVPAKQKSAARSRARAYFELAESYAKRRPPHGLTLVSGPSGSGKSVLAGVLAARLGAVLLSTDMLRKELFEASTEAQQEGLDEGRYSEESRARVYEEIAQQSEAFLRDGRPVVIDGTYIERRQRAPVLDVADRARAEILVVECSAPDEVIRERQKQRQGEAWTTSEGRWEVYLAQKARIEPATELQASQRVSIDTTKPLQDQIDAVLAALPSYAAQSGSS